MPERIQRKRTKGFRLGDAVYIGRGSRYGNPFRVGTNEELGEVANARIATSLYQMWMTHPKMWGFGGQPDLEPLRGKDIACWCPVDTQDCHGEVILHLLYGQPNSDSGNE